MKSDGGILRELISRPEGVSAFGITMPIDAYVAERLGVEVIYAGGFALSARRKKPDMDFLTKDEVIRHAKEVTVATELPVVIDIDTGYGGPLQAMETVYELLESAPRIAAFHIEDQVFPKRCGHIDGKDVIPLNEFLGKIKAVVRARDEKNPSVAVIVRTDAFGAASGRKDEKFGGDMGEVVKRLSACAEEGVDGLWAETPNPDPKIVRGIVEGVSKYLPRAFVAYNMSPSFTKEHWERFAGEMTDEKLAQMGVKFRFGTYLALVCQVFATELAVKEVKKFGLAGAMLNIKRKINGSLAEDIKKLVGVPDFLLLEREFSEIARIAQQSSEGVHD